MKYCPKCGEEFIDEVNRCDDCGTGLISEREREKILEKQKEEDQEVFVKVKTVDDQFESDVIKDALEKENIPVLVRSFRDTSFDGIYIPQKGWGVILVPEAFRVKAKYIIEKLESQEK